MQLYAYSFLVFALLVFQYVIMKNFSSSSKDFTSLGLSSEIDRQHKPEEVMSLFRNDYYYQPEARAEDEEKLSLLAQPQSELRESDDEESFDVHSDDETSTLIKSNAE